MTYPNHDKMSKFKLQPKKIPLQINNHYQKRFDYSKGQVTLGFTLNLDNKKDFKDFLEILDQCRKDVLETMEEIK